MNRVYITILLISFSQFSCSQNSTPTDERISAISTFSKSQYEQDLQQLVNILKNNHPQLNEYISKDSYELLVQEKIKQLADKTTIGEFVWICRSIVASIGCGHTVVPTLGTRLSLSDAFLFPLNVKYINSMLFVIDPLINFSQISVGDEIISINGISAAEVKEKIAKHISSDAYNLSLKDNFINNGFMEYCAYQFGFPKSYEIEYRRNTEVKKIVLSQLETYTEKPTVLNQCENNLCFEMDQDNNLASITIRSFYYYRDNFPEFKAFIDSCFREIQSNNIKHLIIDLRNNGGGDPYCGSYLLQHIADKPYQYYKQGTYGYDDLQEMIQPNPNGYLGKPYILINGRCFSTTGQLCALIRENDFGIFVGKETGATYHCNATVRPFILEHTEITTYIATRTYETAVESLPKNKGISPDFEIELKLTDILSSNDAEMEFVINLIKSKNQK